jgi:hypothetical protein
MGATSSRVAGSEVAAILLHPYAVAIVCVSSEAYFMFSCKRHNLLTFKLAPGVAVNLLCVGKGNAYVGKGMPLEPPLVRGDDAHSFAHPD